MLQAYGLHVSEFARMRFILHYRKVAPRFSRRIPSVRGQSARRATPLAPGLFNDSARIFRLALGRERWYVE